MNEGTMDSLIFRFYSTKNILLYEQSVEARYTFIKPVITGLEINYTLHELQLFPVPATDKISLRCQAFSQYHYEIFDIQGKIMLTGEAYEPETIISTADGCQDYIQLKL